VEDLLFHFPYRYLNTAKILPISEVKVGEEVTVVGEIKAVKKIISRNKVKIINVGIFDGGEYLYGVWFNQEFIADRLSEGMVVAFSGKTSFSYGQLQIENPLFEIIDDDTKLGEDTIHTGRIIPFHPATQYLSSARLRRIIKNMIDTCPVLSDPLPSYLLAKYDFLNRQTAFKEIHFPSSDECCQEARGRLLYEELFLLQVGLWFRKNQLKRQITGIAHQTEGTLVEQFYQCLSFNLTNDQKQAISEIFKDMASPLPMNRLLQGEVGSGKTCVAIAALLAAVQGRYQAVMMAPTEILAEQHFKKINSLLDGLPVESALLKGGLAEKEKKKLTEKVRQGKIDIVIGTHALIQENIAFHHLGLVIVDEQHRFGVQQRVSLKEKGTCPDVLVMTATPIPRTLSLTLYGDLDISVIKELPGEKNLSKHVETYVLDKNHRNLAYEKIKSETKEGRQTYIICPLIEESDKLEVKAVMSEA
ncbi:MAG: DEAD/DEAH box helicase, partial [Candidatus Subteraquimicrobiales bacterium]|nr:DEAD/DEAH box helicase [Candidatus Subteraquimicrobiales bacterium]